MKLISSYISIFFSSFLDVSDVLIALQISPGIVVHRIDAWSPLAPHRPDLYGDRDRGDRDRDARGSVDRGVPAASLQTAPLPHIVSALPRAHNFIGTDSDQPSAYRDRPLGATGWQLDT